MAQDHYKTLGVNRSASKDEIKTAFRKSALEYHPDRHAQSSAAVRDSAAAKFRRASEAYETLIDESRRLDYDSRLRTGSYGGSGSSGSGNYSYTRTSTYTNTDSGSYTRTYTYTWNSSSGSGGGGGGTNDGRSWSWSWSRERAGGGGGSGSSETGWQFLSRVMMTRRFLIGFGCVSILVGSALLIEDAIERAWERNNSGKSFAEAMEALEKARVKKDGDH